MEPRPPAPRLRIERVVGIRDTVLDSEIVGIEIRVDREPVTTVISLDGVVYPAIREVTAHGATVAQLLDASGVDDWPDATVVELDPAETRARLARAVELLAALAECVDVRWAEWLPVLRFLVGRLPDGGTAPEWREWTDEEAYDLAFAFRCSPFGAALDASDRWLVDAIIEHGRCDDHGQPDRWGPRRVHALLADWDRHPTWVTDDVAPRLPAVLRAFIRWTHHELGVSDRTTERTLAAIAAAEPAFRASLAELVG